MPRTLAIPAIAMACWAQSADAEPASNGPSLVEFADRFDQAQLRKDGRLLETMVADDLVFITGSGERKDKKDFIAGWTDPADSYDPIVLKDRVVQQLGPDVGIVSAETILSGTSGGKKFASRFRFTDTFWRVGGNWRAVHIQVTRIPE